VSLDSSCIKICQFPIRFHTWSPIRVVLLVSYSVQDFLVKHVTESCVLVSLDSSCIKICHFPIRVHICWSPIRVVLSVSYSVQNLFKSYSLVSYWNPIVQTLLQKSDGLYFFNFLELMWDFLGDEDELRHRRPWGLTWGLCFLLK
jgi:hypothetical protein